MRTSVRPLSPGRFQIYYRLGDHLEYLPDLVVETADSILMLEPKRQSELEADDVLAKKAAAEEWCRHASDWARKHEGKPWRYALISHERIADNMTLQGLLAPV